MAVRLHKEGFPVMILVLFLLITIALIINLIEPTQTIIHVILYAAALIFYFYVVRFFRNPIREVVPDDNIILSGADGTVVVIEDVVETEYFKDKRKQVSVFMSPTNVHVNWYPISGKIVYFRHNQGSYFIASKPKSSFSAAWISQMAGPIWKVTRRANSLPACSYRVLNVLFSRSSAIFLPLTIMDRSLFSVNAMASL